ncbi:MAG: hypothetical protein SF162_01220 [bacterium]|nr:hypothetical protein [bacterium]
MRTFRRGWKTLARIHPRQKLIPPPRHLANMHAEKPSDEFARVYARGYARSNENVQRLMKLHQTASIDDLMTLLPAYRPRRNIAMRLRRWMRGVLGLTTYDIYAARHWRDLSERGRAPERNRNLE